MTDHDETLQQLRDAWCALNSSASTIARLGGYLRRSPGMKADLQRAHERHREARATLDRLLAPVAAADAEVERALAQADADLVGLGFIVDGRRVAPERVAIVPGPPHHSGLTSLITAQQGGRTDG